MKQLTDTILENIVGGAFVMETSGTAHALPLGAISNMQPHNYNPNCAPLANGFQLTSAAGVQVVTITQVQA